MAIYPCIYEQYQLDQGVVNQKLETEEMGGALGVLEGGKVDGRWM